MQHNIPSPYRKLSIGGPFVDHTGGLCGAWIGGRVQVGLRVGDQHCNPHGTCHGGMLATLADMVTPCAAIYQDDIRDRFLPTVSLQLDYMGAARHGTWLRGDARILRQTKTLVFSQGLLYADDEQIVRFSAIYKMGPEVKHANPQDPFGLLGG